VNWTAIAVTFALILVAELPDKTLIATLVLSTRYRPFVVWLGVGCAFGIQTLIAVAAGQILTLFPQTPVLIVTAVLFALGSAWMFHSASSHTDPDEVTHEIEDEEEQIEEYTAAGHRRAFFVSFGVLLAAEWGDLSQLTTAGLSARFNAPIEVFVGAWLALLVVAGLAVLAGRWLVARLRLAVIQRLAGALLALLAVITAVEAAGLSPI
jgi:putative Ca2+/H+ antiporter (TMEM165/GDT1 family)